MSDLDVGLERSDILCAMVLLKCQHSVGQIETPVGVSLCINDAQRESAWYQEACKYLHQVRAAQQQQKPVESARKQQMKLSARKWEQLHEEFGEPERH